MSDNTIPSTSTPANAETLPAEASPAQPMLECKPIENAEQMEQHLADLVATLQRQLQAARDEQYERVNEAGLEASSMLRAVTVSQVPLTHIAFEHIQQVHDLHKQLGLTLREQQEQITTELTRVRKGRAGLKAYRSTATGPA